jgi:hypothetical protein
VLLQARTKQPKYLFFDDEPYAATMDSALLDSTVVLFEVFCGHHEDVVPKRRDGTFSGLPIKTRQIDRPA